MIRNLMALLAAAMVLGVFGVVSAPGAQASEFHCSVEPCRVIPKPDGEAGSKTAHHVFILKKEANTASFTCQRLTGEGESKTKTTSELTITSLAYDGCEVLGTAIQIDMNGCDYLFKAVGTVTLKCPEGQKIELTISKCTITVGPQGPLAGIKYHDAGTTKSELTVEGLVKGITVTTDSLQSGFCKSLLGWEGTTTEAEYTTGNTIGTGETTAGAMENVWFE